MSSNPATADFVEALRARDRERVNSTAADLLDRREQLGSQWFDIAKVLNHNLEVGLALKAAELGLEQTRASAESRFRFADILAGIGRHSEAIDLLTRSPMGAASALQVDQFVGMCALEMGDIEGAREALDRVVTRWAGAGAAWLSLSALPADDDKLLLSRLRSAEGSIKVGNALHRAQWHYALGNVLDRLDRTDEAFAEFSAGAEIMQKLRPYNAEADSAEAEHIIAGHPSHKKAARGGSDSKRPIFVTGVPRSGTTLIEHKLVGHSEVAGGEELPFAALIAHEASSAPLDAKRAASFGALYLHFGDERFGSGRRFVDKSLQASRYMGLISAILPGAPVVWLRRDPLNCAWSCFRTCFSDNIEWSWSLADIAAHFKAEDRLYEYWRDALGDRLLTINYEEFVTDSEAGTKRLFDHVGLGADAADPASHENKRAVTTSSALQVRQPVYQSSINVAERYRRHLQPFVDAYGA